jgi:hypothetical protein
MLAISLSAGLSLIVISAGNGILYSYALGSYLSLYIFLSCAVNGLYLSILLGIIARRGRPQLDTDITKFFQYHAFRSERFRVPHCSALSQHLSY